jgi:hypothetical protein
MFLWTKTEPGGRFRRVDSGTRESEQPSQRIEGDWPLESLGRKSGSLEWVFSAQDLLEDRASWKASTLVFRQRGLL